MSFHNDADDGIAGLAALSSAVEQVDSPRASQETPGMFY